MRAPYLDAIHTYINKLKEIDEVRANWLVELLGKQCFRSCGLVPEDPFLHSSANLPRDDQGQWCKPAGHDDGTDRHDHAPPRKRDGRILAFVDGSALYPTDPRRTRAGWGVFVGEGHPLNAHGHLPGRAQSSFRGELAAAVHALATIEGPLHIVSDCQAVVEGVRSIILDGEAPAGDDADLWDEVSRLVRGRPDGQVEISWIKSHVDREMAAHLENAGSFLKDDLDGNAAVDELAKKGAAAHGINHRHFRAADDRELIANLAQRMMVTVWSDFYSLYEDDWEQADDDQALGEAAGGVPRPQAADLGSPPDAYGDDVPGSLGDGGLRRDEARRDHHGLQHEDHDDVQTRPATANRKMTTKAIADVLKVNSPEYSWDLDAEEYLTKIVMPDLPSKVSYSPGSHAQIPGRGRVSTAVDMTPIWIEGARWWFNGLRWTAHWASRPERRKPHAYTATFLELVVDAEAATGMEFPGRCWSDKATRFAALLRTLARVHTLEVDGVKATWKAAFDPQVTQPTLIPLDGPKVSGLSRRPRWLSSTTPLVTAANVWRALNPEQVGSTADEERPGRSGREGARATRTFAQDHRIDRSGITQNVVWRSRAEKELAIARDAALRAYYDASDKWQRDPRGPMPVHPDSVSAATRARLRPSPAKNQGDTVGIITITSKIASSSSSCTSTSPTISRSVHSGDKGSLPSTTCTSAACQTTPACISPCSTSAAFTAGATASRNTSASPSGTSSSPPSWPSRNVQVGSHATTAFANTTGLITSTASSSSGSVMAPRVATTLRELRLQQQEDVARNAQAEDSLIKADASGYAHGESERSANVGMKCSSSLSELSGHTVAN